MIGQPPRLSRVSVQEPGVQLRLTCLEPQPAVLWQMDKGGGRPTPPRLFHVWTALGHPIQANPTCNWDPNGGARKWCRSVHISSMASHLGGYAGEGR